MHIHYTLVCFNLAGLSFGILNHTVVLYIYAKIFVCTAAKVENVCEKTRVLGLNWYDTVFRWVHMACGSSEFEKSLSGEEMHMEMFIMITIML